MLQREEVKRWRHAVHEKRAASGAGCWMKILIGTIGAILMSVAQADTLATSILHSFGGSALDGANPFASLVLKGDGNFYGTTYSGGTHNAGTVIKITPGGTLTTMYNFGGSTKDGLYPHGGLIEGSDGNLYGTTQGGGANGKGAIYKITPAGALTTLYSFGTTAIDGAGPDSTLVQGNDGSLYGTTYSGGSNNLGTVFKITIAGSLTPLYSFGTSASDGSNPAAGLVSANDGSFYGTTEGGGSNNIGTIFRIMSNGTLTTLYSFGSVVGDGAKPEAALIIGSDGKLYGTTENGGVNNDSGTAFSVVTDGTGTTLTTLYSFGSSTNDGAFPRSALIEGNDHNFYGTTQGGGGIAGLGTVFVITPTGTLTILHNFTGSGSDGSTPVVGLTKDLNGNFRGTTLGGGSNGTGTVFEISSGGLFATLHEFGSPASSDGSGPVADLVQDANGNFYGTTQSGGTNDLGTIFKITSTGQFTTLYSFGGSASDGANPAAGLLVGGDGNLYGTTLNGGVTGNGSLFQITTAGVLTILHHFGTGDSDGINLQDGTNPEGTLVLGSDGNFYGTTLGGGAHALGTIFKITADGQFTTLYSFGTATADGSNPAAGLRLGNDNSFYGTTYSGGVNGNGTVFRITRAGTFAKLYDFGNAESDGANPEAGLMLGSDESLYGTTNGGGSKDKGTIFKITTSGVLTTLYSFGNDTSDSNGSYPDADLAQGSDGNIYGTTNGGGAGNKGTFFKVTLDGKLTTLYSFGGAASDGSNPFAGVVQGRDGNFYGTTYSGGDNGTGTVFMISMQDPPASSGGGSSGGGSFYFPTILALYALRLVRDRYLTR